jgi:hypothetical protein
MVVSPKLKISTAMIDGFQSPITDAKNANKYLFIKNDGETNSIAYHSINDLIKEINNAGGTIGGGEANIEGTTIYNWESGKEYLKNDLVIYTKAIYQCIVDSSISDFFNNAEWQGLGFTSELKTLNYVATDGQTVFDINDKIAKKEFISVNIENTQLLNSEFDMSEDGMQVILKNALIEGNRVQITYFTNVGLNIGATFIPNVIRSGSAVELSWTNDGGLDNPNPAVIYDGTIFTPSVSNVDNGIKISWTNDGGLDNPEDAILYNGTQGEKGDTGEAGTNGITYTPNVSEKDDTITISWTNNGGLNNPESITISNIKPHIVYWE